MAGKRCIHCKKPLGKKARNPLACSPCILRWHRIWKEAIPFPTDGPWKDDSRFRWPTREQLSAAFLEQFGEQIFIIPWF